jgi:hypothetical protein
MTTYTGRSSLTIALRVKLMEVHYVPKIWQWFSIICSQVDASKVADMSYLEGALPAGGELVRTHPSKHALEH